LATSSIPQQPSEETKPIESADLVIGILSEVSPEAVSTMCNALRTLPGSLRIAVLQNSDPKNPVPLNSSAAPPNSSSVFFAPSLLAKPSGAGPLSMAASYQSIFAAGEKLQSRACCILASRLESEPHQWAYGLAEPLIGGAIDLVVPHYARHKFEGLLNSCIVAPLMRALYGKRLSNPMGPDFGLSRLLVQKLIGKERSARAAANGFHPLVSMTPVALCENLRVAEVHFGTRSYPAPDWTNTASLMADVLGPVFLDIERNAACWQRMRVSAAVPAIGTPASVQDDTATIDTTRLVESFALGTRELQEIWGLILPPATLFELRKLSRLAAEQFRMPDELWVRIVYDFALAHRLRTINRDHLLKSMTPLYLGWVASYAHDLQTDSALGPDQRIERLGVAFEAGKPYFVSRWRWPDRFNP
jgi:glucosylglycerate synthase